MSGKLIKLFSLFFLLLPAIILAANPIGIGENFNIGIAISNILDYTWLIFATISVIMFIIAGMMFLTARGEPAKISGARQAVIWGVVGVGVALISVSLPVIVKSLLGV